MSSFSSPLQDDFPSNPFGLPDPPTRKIPTDPLEKIIFAFEACRIGIQQSQFSNYSIDSIVWCLKTLELVNKLNGEVTQNGENQIEKWKKQKNIDSMGQVIALFIRKKAELPEFELEIENHFDKKHIYVDYFRHSSPTDKLHWLNFLMYLGFIDISDYKLIDVCDRNGKRYKWTDLGNFFVTRIREAIAPKETFSDEVTIEDMKWYKKIKDFLSKIPKLLWSIPILLTLLILLFSAKHWLPVFCPVVTKDKSTYQVFKSIEFGPINGSELCEPITEN